MPPSHDGSACDDRQSFKDGGYPGEIGVVHSLETKYPASDSEEDRHACFLDDALSVRFLLDATYLGYYSEETMRALDEICEANGASYKFSDSDFDVMKKLQRAMIISASIIINAISSKRTTEKPLFTITERAIRALRSIK